ncbi:MAG: heavy metal translocating P-type ATPase [Peptococcaceae bacterium]|nr:heavy metal translocating P-type ATPase [Peptococcaceae bacterium]
MTKKQKRMLMKIIIAAIIYAIGLLMESGGAVRFTIYLAGYLIIGYDVLLRAAKNITRGQVFDENFLMAVATLGAFALGDYPEGIAVMLFYQVGELFQSVAVSKSRKSIAALMDIRPDHANVFRDGQWTEVDPEEVAVGDKILIKPGERVPLDGKVLEGSSSIDTSALTGESVPRDVGADQEVISGCININGTLTVEVTKEYGQSTVARILDLVENSSSKKANIENFITRFARYYTPVVVVLAALLMVVPPLLIPGALFSDWIYRGLTFLVISCPCALVISVPLSFFGGMGGASKEGILVKGGNYLEALAASEIVVFDKTGTLTKGSFEVTEIVPAGGVDKDELLEMAALTESYSDHPISQSLKRAWGKEAQPQRVDDVRELPGLGVSARVDGHEVACGNKRLMEQLGLKELEASAGTVVYVAIDGSFAGHILISDEIKEDAAEAIRKLKAAGVKKTVMLTGDNDAIGRKVAADLGLDQVYTQLLPADKVEKMESLLQEKSAKGKLAYVGDGINDAPVLARADVGIAMGGLGSDAAIEAADVVIMTDEPSKLAAAIRIARKTALIARENVVFALSVKILVLILGAMGIANMWAAVFADVGVAVIAILNAIRSLYGVKE